MIFKHTNEMAINNEYINLGESVYVRENGRIRVFVRMEINFNGNLIFGSFTVWSPIAFGAAIEELKVIYVYVTLL